MGSKVLLTSFAPWQKHQRSNASDDVLVELQARGLPDSVVLLRQLPVNLPVAREMAIAKARQLQPQVIVLCGMAESRSRISLEQQATVREKTYRTAIDLNSLAKDLKTTEISHDAGRYVCNSLYYAMLDYTVNYRKPDLACHCLFVHIPLIKEHNRSPILDDVRDILDRLLLQIDGVGFS